ncbi:MAG: flagellar filament capping protein FliD [Thiohalobacteraceae bacterium]
MISSPGVGSGLDVQSIVTQLMALERRPVNAMQQSLKTLDSQLSAYGRLRSAMASFQTAMKDLKSLDAFQVNTVSSTNADALTATANSSAAPGTLNVQVLRLAQAHKEGSLAQPDTGTTVIGGEGDQMTITVGGEDVVLDLGGMTLAEIRSAINAADAGVSATIVSESASSHRLVLTAQETGADAAMTLGFTGTLGTDLGMATINDVGSLAELDAEILVDNTYTITRGSNSIDDAIDGLTINLKAETTGPETLSVARDTEAVTESVQAFVDAYNALRSTISGLAGKELKNDSTMRSLESSIQAIFNAPPTGLDTSYAYLSQVGISLQRDGSMALDRDDLQTAIETDFSGVAQLFANDNQGYVFRLNTKMTELLQADGLIDGREDGINASKKTLNSRIEGMEYRLGLVEQRYYAQYTALDTLMGQMQTTSAFLTQQLSALSQLGRSRG